MKKILWGTDLHLNFLHSVAEWKLFIKKIKDNEPDALVLTGDITEAPHLSTHLQGLSLELETIPVYFVLGNHDYYRGGISKVREVINNLSGQNNLFYLPSIGRVPLNDNTVLLGHDGWYDGQYANWFAQGVVQMADYMLIEEFRNIYSTAKNPDAKIFGYMNQLANECATFIRTEVASACKDYKNVIFATHVPPWPENAVYKGKISDWRWLPNFSSKLCGDALLEVARNNKETKITVLCGHSHGSATYSPMPNLTAHTGFAEYHSPWLGLVPIELIEVK